MRKKKWQDQKRMQRNWFWRNLNGELKYSVKNSWKECPPEKYRIMQ